MLALLGLWVYAGIKNQACSSTYDMILVCFGLKEQYQNLMTVHGLLLLLLD